MVKAWIVLIIIACAIGYFTYSPVNNALARAIDKQSSRIDAITK